MGHTERISTCSQRSHRPSVFLLDASRPHKRSLVIAAVISVISAAPTLAQPLVISDIISRIGSEPISSLVFLLIILVLLSTALQIGQRYVVARIAESIVLSLRRTLVERILRLKVSAHDTQRPGDFVSRVCTDTMLVRTAFTGGMVEVLGGLFVMCGAVIAMIIIDPLTLVIVLTTTALALTAIITVSSKIQAATQSAQEAVGEVGAGLHRAVMAIRTVRASRAESEIEEDINRSSRSAYDQGLRIGRISAILEPISDLAQQVAFLCVLGVGGVRVASGAITVADLVSFILFLFMIALPLGQISSAIVAVRSALGALQRVQELLDLPVESEPSSPVTSRAPAIQRINSKALEVKDLTFSYDGEVDVLSNVSFSVERGSVTAITGHSGSGKSTLLSLIEKFYEVEMGKIRVEGTDITQIGSNDLRSIIGLVEQEAPVLHGTVRENLTFGAPAITDKECLQVLERVNLLCRFQQSGGLNTMLGDHGVNLSGGERQRIALARALLSDARLLLFDEPTASIDSKNEDLIQDAINSLAGKHTLIIVSHRLLPVSMSDQIIVLDSGEVSAIGSHAELLQVSNTYRDLARRQLLV